MRIARFLHHGQARFALVDEQADMLQVLPNKGSLFSDTPSPSSEPPVPLGGVQFLPPVQPSKIILIGKNYATHAAELGDAVAERMRVFFKAPSAIIGHGQAIQLPTPAQSTDVHYEAELAVVIGQQCRNVPASSAMSVVLGYTCANDVTARDIQRTEGLVSYAKSFDTFCPLGPWLETDLDPSGLRVTCSVNGELRQDGNTGDLIWPVPELVAHVSGAMTLLPGDVILTGTPAGVGPLALGDVVSVMVEGIGTLTNTVVGGS